MPDWSARPGPASDFHFQQARRAVELGWITREQVEAAVLAHERDAQTPLLAHLPLTPDQRATLEALASAGDARRSLPGDAVEALKDPNRRIGRFVLVEPVGEGGMGIVFKAWEPQLQQWVAIKLLRRIGDDTARAYFTREAQLAAGLDHPHIARIYEIGEHGGQPFIAMQYVNGQTLAAAKPTMKLEEKVEAVKRIAQAVQHAHARNVIHRDLKPGNVMLDRNGHVYVMDFGLAKEVAVGGESLGGSSLVVGTPQYMAPEQAAGKADRQSDLYGLGAILYELVTGRPPFTGETPADVLLQVLSAEVVWPRKLSPGTPADLEAIILRCLEKEPRRRYATAQELLEDLEAWQAGNPLPHARRPTLGYVLARKIRKQPLLWGALAALVAAIAGGVAFGSWTLIERDRALRREAATDRLRRAEAEERSRELDLALATARENLANAHLFKTELALGEQRTLDAIAHWAAARELANSLRVQAFAYALPRPDLVLERTLPRQETRIMALAFSADGAALATLDAEGEFAQWDIETGRRRIRIAGAGRVRDTAASGSGFLLAAATEEGRVHVREVDSGQARPGTPLASDQRLRALLSDGRMVVEQDAPTHLRLLDPSGSPGWVLQQPPTPFGASSCTAASPEGTWIAGGRRAPEPGARVSDLHMSLPLFLWEVASGRLIRSFEGNDQQFLCAAFSPDATQLVAGTEDGTLFVWRVEDGEELARCRGHRGAVESVLFVPDSYEILSVGADRSVRIWDSWTSQLQFALTPHLDGTDHVAISADGRRIATAGHDGAVRIWRRASPLRNTWIKAGEYPELDAAASPDAKLIASVGESELTHVWDAATGRPVASIERGGRAIGAVSLSPDGRWIAEAAHTGAILLSDFPSFTTTKTLADGALEGDRALRGVLFSPDGSLLAASSAGVVRLWNAATGKEAAALESDPALRRPAFSPDGRFITLASRDLRVRLWDLAARRERWSTAPTPAAATCAAVAPDGRWVATGHEDGRVVLWRGEDGTPHARLAAHTEALTDLEFSPDGKFLATASGDGAVKLWDPAEGKFLVQAGFHWGGATSVCFSPDALSLITTGRDTRLRVGGGYAVATPLQAAGLTGMKIEGLETAPLSAADEEAAQRHAPRFGEFPTRPDPARALLYRAWWAPERLRAWFEAHADHPMAGEARRRLQELANPR